MNSKLSALLFSGALITMIGLSATMLWSTSGDTEDSLRSSIRLEQMMDALSEQNDNYYNKIDARLGSYSTTITDYQFTTNMRLNHLEARVKELEEQIDQCKGEIYE